MAISSIAQAADLTFKTECIGSYSIDLPDNIEIALFPIERYLQPKKIEASIKRRATEQ